MAHSRGLRPEKDQTAQSQHNIHACGSSSRLTERLYGNVEQVGNLKQPRCWNTVRAAFDFLHLLKAHVERGGESLLRSAPFMPVEEDIGSNHAVEFDDASRHAASAKLS